MAFFQSNLTFRGEVPNNWFSIRKCNNAHTVRMGIQNLDTQLVTTVDIDRVALNVKKLLGSAFVPPCSDVDLASPTTLQCSGCDPS